VGITLYGYIILMHLLSRRDRFIFMCIYWLVVVCITVVRVFILITRVQIIMQADDSKQPLVNRLHTAYFSLLAVLECLCAFFLLRKFAMARSRSRAAHLSVSLVSHLMRGTEIRVASLCLIGVGRAVAYFFQPGIVEVSTTASQIDRFFYALECAFPVML
jgi:Na+/melibiose symporter-like transporter